MNKFCKALARRKVVERASDTELSRVLNIFDLTSLGVGNTLGLGIYILAGKVAYDVAGPAVIISFLIAAVASAFAGFCYAEFAARVPKAGSAYIYSYVTVGEFVAFTIGWNLILEYLIGTASVARGLSEYIDSHINHTMSRTLTELAPINVSFLSPYPDVLSSIFVLIVTVILALGVRESSRFNNILTVLNMMTIFIVIVAGALNADISNWFIPQDEVPTGFGTGGFMPFGFAGIMTGAAKCFYGFIGFDIIASTGEEAVNPKRDIPLSIILSLIIIFLSYLGISVVLTMMLPYYKQNPSAPFPEAFDQIDWQEIKWIVSIGALFGLSTGLLGSMFPMPRVIYAMGLDGLLCRKLASVNKFTKTPLLATVLCGIFSALCSVFLDLDQLIDLMSIGTLQSYSIVAICVLILRFEEEPSALGEVNNTPPPKLTAYTLCCQLCCGYRSKRPSRLTSYSAKIAICIFTLGCIAWCGAEILLDLSSSFGIAVLSIITFLLLWICVIIGCQPKLKTRLFFSVPLVPYLPCLSIFMNLYLMFEINVYTWCNLILWMVLGYIIYFAYGINFQVLGRLQRLRNKKSWKRRDNACLNTVFEPD